MIARRLLVCLALVPGLLPVLLAAPAGEVIREEAFGYRVVGSLPRGWARDDGAPAWTFRDEGVPHAHVHLFRQHVETAPDPLDALEARAHHFRFPGAPADAPVELERTEWGGRPAARLVHATAIGGVACTRRVTATVAGGVYFECIETVYGARTPGLPGCAEGLATFREGFQPLVAEVPPDERTDPAERAYADPRLGYALVKPRGLLRRPVEPAKDPGCVLAFERTGPEGGHLLVRLFEYGVRGDLDPEAWCAEFFRAFALPNREAIRETGVAAPPIEGARQVHAERFAGRRDGRPVVEQVIVAQSESGRVFTLRLRMTGKNPDRWQPTLTHLLSTLRIHP